MADYINREDFLKKWCESYCRPKQNCRDDCSFYDAITQFPAADVRENVPAHWIFDCERVAGDGWTHKQRHCSNCGFQTVECVNFCQNCGADMRPRDELVRLWFIWQRNRRKKHYQNGKTEKQKRTDSRSDYDWRWKR